MRQVDLTKQDGVDLLDQAISNVQDELDRYQEFGKTLNMYGIYLMPQTIQPIIVNEAIGIGRYFMQEAYIEQVMQKMAQDYRKITTLVFLERYRDLGHGRCNICLKDFKLHERVKRFPRECDHLFHIKCLDVWLKLDSRCPACMLQYMGPVYTNPSIDYSDQHSSDHDYYSVFNEWK